MWGVRYKINEQLSKLIKQQIHTIEVSRECDRKTSICVNVLSIPFIWTATSFLTFYFISYVSLRFSVCLCSFFGCYLKCKGEPEHKLLTLPFIITKKASNVVIHAICTASSKDERLTEGEESKSVQVTQKKAECLGSWRREIPMPNQLYGRERESWKVRAAQNNPMKAFIHRGDGGI